MASSKVNQKRKSLTGNHLVNRLIDFSESEREREREPAKEKEKPSTPPFVSTHKSLRRSKGASQLCPTLREEYETAAEEKLTVVQQSSQAVDRWPDLGDPVGGSSTINKRASYLLSTYNSSTMSHYGKDMDEYKAPKFNFYGASPEGSEVEEEREHQKLMKRNAIQVDTNMPSPLFQTSQGLGLAGLTSGGAAVAKDEHAPTSTVNDDSLTSLDSVLDSFIEDLNRDQAASSIRSSSRHVAKRTASIRNTPESATRSTNNGSFPRSVSQPILPSGLRSSCPAPPQDDSPFRETPSRICNQGDSLAYSLRTLRTPSGLDKGSNSAYISYRRDGNPNEASSPTRKHKLIPKDHLSITKTRHASERSAPLYFTRAELRDIDEKVLSKTYNCAQHQDCTDCKNTEYAYHENIIMSTSMPPEERNKIISNNRSLRNIKNELETLAENGAISDAAFDAIMKSLPAESSLGGASTRNNPPARSSAPEASMEKLSLNNQPPPAYQQAATPPLPNRNNSAAAPPEVMRATALYAYSVQGDCNFNVGDEIIVLKVVNDDWWVGKNARTNSEGAFPKTYVQPHNSPSKGNQYPGEKANNGGYPAQAQQSYRQSGPPPPGPSNPYNSAVPPMQISNEPMETKPGKGGEMGKKFGKKLGNAAVFGAGATIGGKIVNSIF